MTSASVYPRLDSWSWVFPCRRWF